MNPAPSVHRNLISPRSRRLRVTGLLLLLALFGMTAYGVAVLMPTLKAARQSRNTARQEIQRLQANPQSSVLDRENAAQLQKRENRVVLAKVIFAYGYWTVWGMLALLLVLVAWLDFREVSRAYLRERQTLWTEAARSAGREALPPDEGGRAGS